ncbi:DUF2809 domain-containing protein [Ilyomonas limi]|uniref:DUF2809 domain-containing protein n=1 Tax=Ilyomonas limi TaxID=2575867 RepID=A0A4V5UUT6_9BACT|nr:DUF2809 domain-containing protein [Ilyomonas limi]TKK68883.1 DUF2809 domain-containing protein [Ilyomonas limi]
MTVRNKRWLYAVLIIITIPSGLATRCQQQYLPPLIDKYGGDVLAATCIFFGCRLLCIKWTLPKVACLSYLVSVLIEIQQLYQAPWAVQFRNITLVGILLGHGFLWSDMVCYAVGTLIGWLIGAGLEFLFTKCINPNAG